MEMYFVGGNFQQARYSVIDLVSNTYARVSSNVVFLAISDDAMDVRSAW